MRCDIRTGILLLVAACAAVAQQQQQPPAAAATTAAGVSNEWDTRAFLQSLTEQAKTMKPLLDKLEVKEWVKQGASETYLTQSEKAYSEITYLGTSAQNLAQQPEKLPAAIDTLYRLENLDTLLTSLSGGVRKYQNPAVGDLMQSVIATNYGNREKLRQYVLDLATQKEQEYAVMDKEAQRCRGELSRQPVTKPAPARSTAATHTAVKSTTTAPEKK